jgi:hypothetical protein
MRKVLAVIAVLVAVGGMVNFVTFFASSMQLGGDAQNGYEAGGHFYVSSHGHTTEVSEAEWRWSLFQAQSVCITHPLGMLAMAYLLFQYIFPAVMYGGRNSTAVGLAQQITQTAVPRASVQCGGQIGMMNFRGPLLRATLYPDGLVLKGILMPTCAIPRTAITQVRYRNEFWTRGIEIRHTDKHVGNPILLGIGTDTDFWRYLHTMIMQEARETEPPPAN